MVEAGNLPTIGVVAGVACCVGQDMGRTLASSDITIVAELTGIDHRRMTKACHGPVIGGMADITGRCSRYMSGMFASGGITVMAGFTRIGDTTMIEGVNRPAIGGMTDVALLIGIDMGGVLTGCLDAVVTAGTYASSGHSAVVEGYPQP